MTKDYLKEPIIPWKSIGGINLGNSYDNVIAKLGEPLKENQSGEYANLTYNGLSVHLRHGITFN